MLQPSLKKLDFTIADVNDIYSGPVGVLWEMLMGEQIHVGGEQETLNLAKKLPISKNTHILDICSALGGPARMLVQTYGCSVTGLDATQHMIDEAVKRTKKAGLSNNITYKLGNALDIPYKSNTFDIVWGQDAWCYITDKERLIKEAYRVLKPQGFIAFTDWLQVGTMSEQEWKDLNSFMAFPYIETLPGYETLLKKMGFAIEHKEDLSNDFIKHCHQYQTILRTQLKDSILKTYGTDLFQAADHGLNLWVQAADQHKVGCGRIIAKKIG